MRLIDRRIGLIFALFLLLLGAATARAAWIGTAGSGDLKARAATQQVEELEVSARRGTITDRNGVELAVSEDSVTVFGNPLQIEDPAGVAARLAPLVREDEQELTKLLADRSSGFVYLAHKIPPADGQKVEKLEIEGIGTVSEPRRAYPQGELAGQLIGAVGTENYGLTGIEQQYEETLHGDDGERKIVRDALGQPVSIVDTDSSTPGEDLQLTIDAALQERVEAVMGEVADTFAPKGATAVVMDPRNGEVLSLANWPRVDPNDIGAAEEDARENRAVTSAFEPGSTFKAFTVAGALEEGVIAPETRFDLPPELQVADRTIGEAHVRGYVNLSVGEILAQSSNVGSVMIGQKLGPKRFDKWVRRFGFGSLTGVDLPGESPGIVLRPREYSGSSIGNLPIGQGIAVTPLQMATGFSAIANGGVLHEPTVIEGEEDEGRRVVSKRTAEQVASMLEGVLAAGGTAEEAQVPGYVLAGKTGTAEKIDPDTGVYSETKFFSSFIGFAPARNPRLMVAVMVDEPSGMYYGGEVAAPAFERIMQFALPYLRIPPD
ncbi:MAG TPA: penicillin-binding protein 2 [Solirubrobacteraceae bacterium]|nr:penicillin-binding protein 2 [Solirubrobacteraceae bacterium]